MTKREWEEVRFQIYKIKDDDTEHLTLSLRTLASISTIGGGSLIDFRLGNNFRAEETMLLIEAKTILDCNSEGEKPNWQ